MGQRDPFGYGKIKMKGKTYRTNRIALKTKLGRWPEPMALHTCDNPPCCNPAHLYEGGEAENSRDKVMRGRVVGMNVGSTNGHAKLNDDIVREMRALYATGGWTYKALGERYGVSHRCIGTVIRNERWTHVN